jgi:mono/diheme cytochrome c family protein
MRSRLSIAMMFLACALAAACAWAAEPTPEQLEFFEKKVRPVLASSCLECHGQDAQESELRLDSLAAMLKGGTRGPAIVPGNPAESLLIRAIGHGETLQMPPKKKLPAGQIADLAEWVKQGAPWPNEKLPEVVKPVATRGLMTFTAKQKSHWAFQPIAEPPPPEVKDSAWPQSPIDRFILAMLEAADVAPSPPADKRTLLRRATFDLTGLPPTPEEVDAFLADNSPDAFARVADRLLASPRYGEKYGRHWLDLARYGDSNGLDENLAYASAFRYRDYVIGAFNKDKPYDRFVQEQIAGDLLSHASLDEELAGIVATGFLSLGAKMLAEDDPVKMQMDIIDEQIDTLGKAFLGLTLGCARCHDHKFDPVDQPDYYALAGIFKSTKTMENHKVVAVWQERPLADKETIARHDEIKTQLEAKQGDVKRLTAKAIEDVLTTERKRAGEYLWAAHQRQQRKELLSKAMPLGSKPAEELAAIAGLQLVEAENYVRGNVIKDTTSWGVGIGVLVNRGELPNFAEYDLTIAAAGTYQLELRYAAAASRPCKVFVNGKLAIGDAAGQVTGSWHPDGQKWFIEGLVDLPAGKVTIRLEQPQFFPHIDKLLIAPASGEPAIGIDDRAPAADLKEEFVRQWQRALNKSSDDAESIFAPWHQVARHNVVPSLREGTDHDQKLAQWLDLPSVKSPRELAERYGKLFAAADEAWKSLKASTAGKEPTRLDDPLLEAARQVLYGESGPFAAPKNVEDLFATETRQQLQQLRDEAAAIEKTLPPIPTAMAVSDASPENVRIHIRGSHLTLAEEVPRRFLRIVAGENQTPITDGRSGRLELAQWLTRPDHPLTSRVMVNRLWQWHFGDGLVRSSDNFGLLGEMPTHPELLDWLARRFVDDGWEMKRMQRRLVLSAVYQQASGTLRNRRGGEREGGRGGEDLSPTPPLSPSPTLASDPENRLLSVFPRRRLEAEEIRDSILFTSGQLDSKMGGSYLPTPSRQYVTSTASVNPAVYNIRCRSVYVPVVRSALYEVFQSFDFADPSVLVARRDATTVAPQALFMLNSQLTADASRALATELLARGELDDAARVRTLYERCYGRPASDADVKRAIEFVTRYAAPAEAQSMTPGDARHRAWQALCRGVMAASEFVYIE